jgi:hypothetical protein
LLPPLSERQLIVSRAALLDSLTGYGGAFTKTGTIADYTPGP